jgi:hypothetical protein
MARNRSDERIPPLLMSRDRSLRTSCLWTRVGDQVGTRILLGERPGPLSSLLEAALWAGCLTPQ